MSSEITEAAVAEAVEKKRWTVSVDFDGVIHSYVTPWIDAATIPDPPIDGAIEWLTKVSVEYDVVILTTRALHDGGAEAVEAYLREHGYDGEVTVTASKLPAIMYVDDRAWRFNGKFPSLGALQHLRPWKVGDPLRTPAKIAIRKAREQQRKAEEANHKRKVILNNLYIDHCRLILRDKTDEWFALWWEEASQHPWQKRVELAWAEAEAAGAVRPAA